MSSPEHLKSFVGRLATFESPKQLTKRRASSTKKKTATTVAWPHETPSPEDLARAGFYYSPSANHPDNVVCFMCDRKLDGWEPEDVPALEHLSHAPDCAWAINVCLSLRDPDENEDPMSEKMVAARTATFAGSWPHEKKKSWKCKTKKMVEAGWCYDPSPDYDDGASCFYCMLSLDGWEPKDNPMEEHRKRSPECPFFMLMDVYAGARKATKGRKGRASTASQASRLSIQSSKDFDTFSEAPSLMSLGDDGPHEDDSVLTTASNATTASMARGKKGTGKTKAAAKETRKTIRGKKAAEESSVMEIEPTLEPTDADLSLGDLNATDGDSVMTTATTASRATKGRKTATKAKTTKGTKKASRATKKAAAADSTLLDEPTAEIGETEMEVEPVKPTGRATRRVSRVEAPSYVDQTSQLDSQAEIEPPKKKATRAKGGRKAKVVEESRLSNDASQLQSELEEALTRADQEEAVKPKRGKKRTSDGVVKADDSVMIVEEPPKPAKGKRGRKAKQVEEEPAPKASPSKRGGNVIGGLNSAYPWEAVDLENIFLQSPTTKRLFYNNGADMDKENSGDWENLSLDEAVRKVRRDMTSPEKKMTVEQWVQFQAEKGEQQLRDQCERMVGIFETQGTKAMKTLEGIRCSN
ncbi:putative chromosome segregation protein [Neofusicoccum parvum UCRNP2]|uniref:Putative chromosome segregation protein n=1 Tax=Botryosphaeria parva (strain UCR-NP2) TaxID=1287680 RepID=R1EZF0_BOTPV|nr:putative chromosome segregation protein [Neofusicoccum parvum UCRNP2]